MSERGDESLVEELERLLDAYHNGEVQNRQEAWNLIADFTVSNGSRVVAALAVAQRLAPVAREMAALSPGRRVVGEPFAGLPERHQLTGVTRWPSY